MDKRLIITNYLLHVEWLGANPNPEIVAYDQVPQYWSYLTTKKENITNIPGFKKLVYKNLYPNIDVEYVFHEKEGIKYSLILHPGADPSLVKMKYRGVDRINRDSEGNIHLTFDKLGDIIEHAPLTYYDDSRSQISSSFVLSGDVAGFQLNNYDNTKTVIIDPWVTNPAFAGGFNRGYDVTRDVTGNVYIYGGTNSQYACKKFTSAGAPIWTFNAAILGNWYGDMALDFGGNAYLSSGCCSGGNMVKLNPAGAVLFTTAGSAISEMWRLAQDCNYSKLVAGGGVPSLIANVD